MELKEWKTILAMAKQIAQKEYPYEISVYNGSVPIRNKIVMFFGLK